MELKMLRSYAAARITGTVAWLVLVVISAQSWLDWHNHVYLPAHPNEDGVFDGMIWIPVFFFGGVAALLACLPFMIKDILATKGAAAISAAWLLFGTIVFASTFTANTPMTVLWVLLYVASLWSLVPLLLEYMMPEKTSSQDS